MIEDKKEPIKTRLTSNNESGRYEGKSNNTDFGEKEENIKIIVLKKINSWQNYIKVGVHWHNFQKITSPLT